MTPKVVAPGTPWIWRASFFGETPEVDLALLAEGFHLAYMDVLDLCGSPEAVEHWDSFYRVLTEEHGFARRVALEAISRGALIAYNWAAENPASVACIYADIPVCDFKSWPGGKGSGPGEPGEWQSCLDAYGLSEEAALEYGGNPVDRLAPLADAEVPLLHAYGDSDPVVPFEENTGLVVRRYRNLGGDISLIAKTGAGHESGLADPTPVVEFIRAHVEEKNRPRGRRNECSDSGA